MSVVELKTDLKHIDKIYHVSDIHLRNVKRHKEYRGVFDEFYGMVKSDELDNAIIFVGGDIAHAKTDMSPELVTEIATFFKRLTELHPTVVIAGNHDCNLNNPHRLDVLTPIVDMSKLPDLYYLRDGGVYQFADILITVMSVFDEPDKYIRASELKESSATTKIATFHGMVNKSYTDVGWMVTNKNIELGLFDGYDMVLMGDIHRYQVLQEYETEARYVPEDKVADYVADGWESTE